MIQYPQIVPGIFLARPNRFLAEVSVDGQRVLCHVKNTGRCRELLRPGAQVWCQHHDDTNRKTAYSLITVEKDGRLVNIDSQVPNRVAEQWLRGGGLGEIQDLRREVRLGDSRLDLAFVKEERSCYLEVKGVTLDCGGTARFPDAPTQRGEKHLRELIRAVSCGCSGYVLFVIQMTGVHALEPNWATDPAFSQALCEASTAGVQILAIDCRVAPDTISAGSPVPVVLEKPRQF